MIKGFERFTVFWKAAFLDHKKQPEGLVEVSAAEQRPTHPAGPDGPDEGGNDDEHLNHIGPDGTGKRNPALSVEQSVLECFVRVFFQVREEGFRPRPEGKSIHFFDRDGKPGCFGFIGAIQDHAEP
jgi:hypothetical protein